MRVVQLVCSDGFGGVERYLLNLSRGLAERGVEVVVIGGAELRMRSEVGAYGAWLPGDTPREARRSLRAAGPFDILNTHMSEADLVGLLHRAVAPRTKLVSTRHFASRRGSSAAARAVFRSLSPGISAQLAISAFVAEAVEGESTIVSSGVAPRDDGGERGRIVLLAQRLEPEKDTITAIRAWAAASARHHGWELHVAGSGSEATLLAAEASALGIGDSIRFLGFREDVDELMVHAAAMVAPTPREGLGIAVLEAMAAGTPVVAAAGGGHRETVGAATPELMFPPGDAAAAAAVLDLLAGDGARRDAAGSAQRRLQRERFTLDGQIDGTLELYRKVIAP